jgi:hypothetical protein
VDDELQRARKLKLFRPESRAELEAVAGRVAQRVVSQLLAAAESQPALAAALACIASNGNAYSR